ncbi:protein pufQ [Alphaproteobacteria bacterium GH1-50]|uniref:Protein pufQ n=1 Tax=Kangsaoukella pontilimi TaxID=2691042 RepID=A0A7C9IJ62_9RHOB|nr:cytochrome PufQ [Kangsaoukella pontilimi]MXQ09767.1 protein pufQ [Kangsaoukella pontilimi]
MSDQTIDLAPVAETKAIKKPTTEFAVYFAIIFIATLPLAIFTWALSVLRSGDLKQKGPVARAWTQARIITPMIFAA